MTELDAHTLYVIRRHGDLSDLYGEAPNALTAAREYFGWQLETAEKEISNSGPFLLAGGFTGADILLTTCLDWALVYGLEVDAALATYHSKITARPAYRAAFQRNFAEMIATAGRD